MATMKINFEKTIGKIKPMHGVGQPPFAGTNYSMIPLLGQAGIPFSRLHDVGGVYGANRYVDIHNIFRDFDADAGDPASYDFAFTDLLMKAIVESGVEPFFRLGETIENDCAVRAYRIYPPKDNLQWAKICEGIIRHYTEGWADGFRYNIRYWEIWNEPENGEGIPRNQCWFGTKEQFYELYGTASKYLKSRFPHLKIGGYGSCGFYALVPGSLDVNAGTRSRIEYFSTFFDGFLDYIKENDCPLDFFTWHSYSEHISATVAFAEHAKKRLVEYGYGDAETFCDEWNPRPSTTGTAMHNAATAGTMLAMQDSPLSGAMFYDGRCQVSIYGSLFDPIAKKPTGCYDVFVCFNELYKLGAEVETKISDGDGLYAVTAAGEGGAMTLFSNTTGAPMPLSLDAGREIASVSMIGYGRMKPCKELPKTIPAHTVFAVRYA